MCLSVSPTHSDIASKACRWYFHRSAILTGPSYSTPVTVAIPQTGRDSGVSRILSSGHGVRVHDIRQKSHKFIGLSLHKRLRIIIIIIIIIKRLTLL